MKTQAKIRLISTITIGIFGLLAVFLMPSLAHAGYNDGGCYYDCGGYIPFHPVTVNQMFPTYYHQSYPQPYPVPQPYPQPYPVPQPYPQPYPVPTPVYYPQPTYYPSIQASCYANTSSASVGSPVTWTAYASGGNGYYTYVWSGSENLSGNSQTITGSYYYSGYKTAQVTVYSNGQTVTVNCNNSVNVYSYQPYPVPQPYPYPYPVPAANDLNIGCYSDPATAKVNQPVNWNAEVTGGQAPYTYSWTGSNDLYGSQSSIIKFYSTTGEKYAIVTVTSADGKSGSRACANSLKVTSGSAYYKPAPKPVTKTDCGCSTQTGYAPSPTPSPTPAYNQVAAPAFFSLAYVPWGWVAFLVILILFGTVLYLMFNRQKM